MTILAFDVAKEELVGVRADKNGAPKETFAIANTAEAIAGCLTAFQEKHPHLLIGSEATAEYHRTLASGALARGLKFKLLNPILTKQFTRATVRKMKTDLSDAAIIAKLLAQGEGTLLTEAMLHPLKSVNRAATSLMQVRKTMTAIAAHLEGIGAETLMNMDDLRMRIQDLDTTVEAMRERVRAQVDPGLVKLLLSIPGVGEVIAPTLIAEIGDITRFPSAKHLIAYAGLDPKVRQSGKSLHRNTKITKRGSPQLRHHAYIAASIAVKHDEELKQYFEKKRNEGKQYKEAMVASARKVLSRVYAVWKRQTPYELRCPQPTA